ncbi:MAG: ThiF family adenylyltransferase [Acidobacteriota bacterium]
MTEAADTGRFSRQVLFRPIGREGQEKIGALDVVLVGLGAVGAAMAEMLVRAGVGSLHLVDRDVVEESNLARQALYVARDAEACVPKAVAARERLAALGGPTSLSHAVIDVTPRSCAAIAARLAGRPGRAVLCDATDTFACRYLLSDLAVRERAVLAYGAALGSMAAAALMIPGETPCLRCLFPDPPAPGSVGTCDTVGVIAPAAHVAASLCVAAILRHATGDPRPPRLANLDVWTGKGSALALTPDRRDPGCQACNGSYPSLVELEEPVLALCGRDAYQIAPSGSGTVDLEGLARRLERLGRPFLTPHLLRVDLASVRVTVFADGRALVAGARSESAARKAYAEVVGC